MTQAVCRGLLTAVSEGPRATEAFAAVAAVFVSGLTALAKAQDIGARFVEMAAQLMEKVGVGFWAVCVGEWEESSSDGAAQVQA